MIPRHTISVEALHKKLLNARLENRLPKLVVPVHFAGQSCEMKDIWKLAKEFNFKIIEDASHALGGEYLDNKVGGCQYSDMAVFSFHPVKMITTGEGGAILTNDKKLDKALNLLRTHGITKDPDMFINNSDGDWYYEQQSLGFNYRLSDIQAALGISQLRRIDSFVAKRREIADYYFNNLDKELLPYQHPDTNSSWHLFVIQTKNRKKLFNHLKNNGVQTQVHYIPVYSQPFYKHEIQSNAEKFYERCLSLPIYFDLSCYEYKQVVKSFE